MVTLNKTRFTCFGGGNGNSLQYSCLENPKNRRARQATVTGAQRVGHDRSDSTHTDLHVKSILSPLLQKLVVGTYLVAQWVRRHAPNAGSSVQSLIRELDYTCSNEDLVQPNK